MVKFKLDRRRCGQNLIIGDNYSLYRSNLGNGSSEGWANWLSPRMAVRLRMLMGWRITDNWDHAGLCSSQVHSLHLNIATQLKILPPDSKLHPIKTWLFDSNWHLTEKVKRHWSVLWRSWTISLLNNSVSLASHLPYQIFRLMFIWVNRKSAWEILTLLVLETLSIIFL